MRLILIRHAEAVAVGENGISEDEARPLTDTGRARARAIAATLKRLGLRPDRLLSSPLLRARQTADEIARVWGADFPEIEETGSLAPGGRKRKLSQKLLQDEVDLVAVVGHNPDLSETVGWFLGEKKVGLDLEKGGMACIEFEGLPCKGEGVLSWLVTPEWYESPGEVSGNGRQPEMDVSNPT